MTDPDTQEITTVDLLHVNCEGCEWEMFENLIETGVMQTIRYDFFLKRGWQKTC